MKKTMEIKARELLKKAINDGSVQFSANTGRHVYVVANEDGDMDIVYNRTAARRKGYNIDLAEASWCCACGEPYWAVLETDEIK